MEQVASIVVWIFPIVVRALGHLILYQFVVVVNCCELMSGRWFIALLENHFTVK